MTSPCTRLPHADAVVDRVLKRIEISKMARRLQNRLALAQFKTKHGWEHLTLDSIEPKVEEELRRRRLFEGDMLSDSSSSTSDLSYPSRGLMSSPLKAPFFSDAVTASNGGYGHRKRTYMASFQADSSSPSKRLRNGPAPYKSLSAGPPSWKDQYHLAHSSPIKPRRQMHFTTSTGPNLSFSTGARKSDNLLKSPNYAAQSEDEDDALPIHSFYVGAMRSSPPTTPPRRNRPVVGKRNKNKDTAEAKSGEEGQEGQEDADLLLYLASSPPANQAKSRIDPPSTPPPKYNKLALPSSMMTTPGGGNPFPSTPGMTFDFSDFVHMTPSPAQKPWKSTGKTPRNIAKPQLMFDDMP